MDNLENETGAALTAMQAPTTKGSRSSTHMQPLTIPLIQKTFPAFQLLGDSQLEHLAKVAVWFITAMKDPNAEPYWLSFVGKSGTGKTFLATEIFNKVKQIPHMLQHATLINPILKAFWPKLIKQLRNEEYWRVGNLCESNFAFIDEVAMEHDPSGFGRDK